MNSGFDFSELVKKAIKYLCEGLIIGIVSYAIPRRSSIWRKLLLSVCRRNIRRPRRSLPASVPVQEEWASVGSGLTGGIKLA
jgi:hypothetical protein